MSAGMPAGVSAHSAAGFPAGYSAEAVQLYQQQLVQYQNAYQQAMYAAFMNPQKPRQ
jgi:hypothetical protein